LKKRYVQILESFSKNGDSISQVSRTEAEYRANCRFFANKKVTPEKILEPHSHETIKRMEEKSVVLVPSDTSSLNFHSHKKTTGLGEISKAGKTSVKGIFFHTSFAFTPEGNPLGILDQLFWSRQKELKKKKKRTIEEKESVRWIKSIERTNSLTKHLKANVIHICDREADFYEYYLAADELKQKFIVRANHDREVDDDLVKISEKLEKTKKLGEITIEVENRKKRKAQIEVKSTKIDIHPSDSSEHTKVLQYYVVQAKEKNPPSDEEPIEWNLITSLPVSTLEEAEKIIKYYKVRWMIEVFHKTLKTGLKVEDCKLNNAEKLMKFATSMSIVSWRVMRIIYYQRTNPAGPVSELLNEPQIKLLKEIVRTRSKKKSKNPLTVKEAVHGIARLGGYFGKKNKDPGLITTWRGWRIFEMMFEGGILMSKI
jgi:hypothetical protein